MEERYTIPNFENYCITKSGKVFRKAGTPYCKFEREIKPNYDKGGYMYVGLWEKGKRKRMQVHRLLALTFIPNPQNKSSIDHINRKRDDNRLENLRWVTNKENLQNQEQKGWIYARPNGTFQVQWHEGKKNKGKTFKTREEAEEFRTMKMKEINSKLVY